MACAADGAPAGEIAGPKTGRARLATSAVVFACSSPPYVIHAGSPKVIRPGSAKVIRSGSAKVIHPGSAKEIHRGSAKVIQDR